MHVCLNLCKYVYLYVYMNISMNVCIYGRMHAWMYVKKRDMQSNMHFMYNTEFCNNDVCICIYEKIKGYYMWSYRILLGYYMWNHRILKKKHTKRTNTKSTVTKTSEILFPFKYLRGSPDLLHFLSLLGLKASLFLLSLLGLSRGCLLVLKKL